MEFVAPRVDREASHQSLLAEFAAVGEPIVPWVNAVPYETFERYVGMLRAAADGIDLPPGFVPHSTFWLLDHRGEIVAVSNLRHALTEDLLKYGGHIGYGVRPSARRKGYATAVLRGTLVEAAKRGLRKVRVTCDKENVASARTILRCGGTLEDEEFMRAHDAVISRYWIHL